MTTNSRPIAQAQPEQQQQQQAMQQQDSSSRRCRSRLSNSRSMQEQQEQQAEQQAQRAEQQEQTEEEAQVQQQEQAAAADDNIDYTATAIGAYGSFPQILDQGSALARGGQSASNSYHYASVFPLEPQGTAVPGGLAEWEFVGAESLIVRMNPGRVFHNGDPVTAEDVKFTVDRLSNKAEYNPEYNSAWTGELTWTADNELIDQNTLRIDQNSESASVDAANSLATGGFPVFPRNHLESVGDDEYAQFPVATGPFKFVEWSPDEKIVSVRNEDFYNGRDFAGAPRTPYLAGFEARLDSRNRRPSLRARGG